MNHTCLDHGHLCTIFEEAEYEAQRKREIESEVQSWNWNMSIFECWEFLKEKDDEEIQEYLDYAYKFFTDKKPILELANYFCITIGDSND